MRRSRNSRSSPATSTSPRAGRPACRCRRSRSRAPTIYPAPCTATSETIRSTRRIRSPIRYCRTPINRLASRSGGRSSRIGSTISSRTSTRTTRRRSSRSRRSSAGSAIRLRVRRSRTATWRAAIGRSRRAIRCPCAARTGARRTHSRWAARRFRRWRASRSRTLRTWPRHGRAFSATTRSPSCSSGTTDSGRPRCRSPVSSGNRNTTFPARRWVRHSIIRASKGRGCSRSGTARPGRARSTSSSSAANSSRVATRASRTTPRSGG